MNRDNVLFICHRIPYPPNKGDKIRSFHILRYLAAHYRVHLLTFIDDPADEQYVSRLEEYSVSAKVIRINPGLRKLQSLFGFLRLSSLSNAFYQSAEARQWVKHKVEHEGVSKAVLFSSPMAQFIQGREFSSVTRVMDFVDVDSEKWQQYAAQKPFPMSLVFAYEANRLRKFERQVCEEFDLSVLVSEQEAELFRSVVPQFKNKVVAVSNGVDTEFFNPVSQSDNPYVANAGHSSNSGYCSTPGHFSTPGHSSSAGSASVAAKSVPVLVFTGAMDYWANVDAVCWFAENCFPAIKKQVPDCRFFIVGIRPSEQVKALEKIDGITVTGAVPDIRPYVKHASAVVAPLRIARGIQNKVLEALAMSKEVIATPEALEGIERGAELERLRAEDASQFTDKCVAILEESARRACPVEVPGHRNFVQSHFSWDSHLQQFEDILERKAHTQATAQVF